MNIYRGMDPYTLLGGKSFKRRKLPKQKTIAGYRRNQLTSKEIQEDIKVLSNTIQTSVVVRAGKPN